MSQLSGSDDANAAFFDPPLSSVRQQMEEMGAAAARLLEQMLHPARPRVTQNVLLKPELIVRNSSDAASAFSLAQHILRQPLSEPTKAVAETAFTVVT